MGIPAFTPEPINARPSGLRRRPDNRWLALALRLLLGLTLMTAGAIKLFDLGSFTALVVNYGWAPADMSRVAATLLPVLELLCGALIAAGIFLRPALYAGIALTLLFIVVNSLDLAAGGPPCSCFGSLFPLSSGQSLLIDLGMLVCAGLILFNRDRGPVIFK